MRIAVVSDVHGNLNAFEGVLEDLRPNVAGPDRARRGLTDAGSSPAEIVDRIRDLGWPGRLGNTDEMLATTERLQKFAHQRPELEPLWAAVRELAAVTREALGEERLAWLRMLPRMWTHTEMALVHASPESAWLAAAPDASDAELKSVYVPLGRPIAAYGHIHRSYIGTFQN
jgi:hypothetical protein